MERLLFSRVEVWLVGLILLVALVGAFIYGALVKYAVDHPGAAGPVGEAAITVADLPVEAKNAMDQLVAGQKVSLLAYDQRFDGQTGFTYSYLPGSRPQAGYLLLSRYDGDASQSVVELVDLNSQQILHRWQPDFAEIRKLFDVKAALPDSNWNDPAERVRLIHPLPTADGGLIYQNDSPLVKIDACSQPVWVANGIYNHSNESAGDGSVWVPLYRVPSDLHGVDKGFQEDRIAHVGPDGKVLFEKSMVRILMENGYGHLVFGTADYAHDPTHMNDIQPVLADGPYWKKGDVFVSLRNVSSIVLYRPSEDHIVWLKQWPWVNQHDVDILDDHRISVFDNHKYNFRNNRPEVHGHNDVKIYDFATDTVSSPWAQAMTDQDVRTIDMGRQEIVSDDAVILEETDYGRLMELQRDGSTGWEYVNRAGDGKIYLLNWTRTLDRAEGDAFLAEVRAAGCTAHLEAKL
ncbi:MAG: hypothetical protein KDA73_01815 [Rhodobacteraceae bacterium]|nr:hypothetical protein [Paracoccaceae bacterium]